MAALIERDQGGPDARRRRCRSSTRSSPQCATPEQREVLEQSALDAWLRDSDRDPARRPAVAQNGSEPSLDPFIPRRGRGLMLSASDIDTYRICPLKYKFARVFRIPQEPTIHQRFGIAIHQVLERFHSAGRRRRSPALMELFEASWRRSGFGDSDDELQFRERRWPRWSATGSRTAQSRVASRSGSSAASPSGSARTCCAAAWTASTATPTAATS